MKQWTRKRKLTLNTVTSLLYQITAIVCGFILPRLFLTHYGSAVNGLVSSITQFLGFISLCELGVGSVVQSALYKPLANNDERSISEIVKSAENFFRKIAIILLIYTIALMGFYPLITIGEFDYLYTLVLIFVISISTFAQYYFGITYKLLLNADQLGFINYSVHIITLILNTLVCIVLMKHNASIQIVKLSTSLIFLIQPLTLAFAAKRRYRIDRKIELHGEPIKQKWNGLAQHIAAVILNNTDTVVLTLFSTLENVSIYAVYYLVVNGVKQIVTSLTSGIQAMFGNMLAKGETDTLNKSFQIFEWLLHTTVTLVFSITGALVVPFVRVYTSSVNDANYIVPLFAILITFAQASYCLRLPYNIMVLAAGHYKQTQWSAITEAVLNVVVSIVLVFKFGLIGVAIGTLVAMLYRTVYFALYLSKHIIFRNIKYFIKQLVIDFITVLVFVGETNFLHDFLQLGRTTYTSWVILAIKVGFIFLITIILINAIFYNKVMIAGIGSIRKKFLKRG